MGYSRLSSSACNFGFRQRYLCFLCKEATQIFSPNHPVRRDFEHRHHNRPTVFSTNKTKKVFANELLVITLRLVLEPRERADIWWRQSAQRANKVQTPKLCRYRPPSRMQVFRRVITLRRRRHRRV